MNTTNETTMTTRIANALGTKDSSVRLQAAMSVGSRPDPELLDTLIERCAVEPDFFVRDMLSWALTRLPAEITLPRVRQELGSERAQARSQALHTLSKIKDRSAWPWITRELLRDPDDEVARTAWRVAVVFVPDEERKNLSEELVLHLGRGDRDTQLSLSRSLVDLGNVIEPALKKAAENPDAAVAAHAKATETLLHDPEAGFDGAIDEAKRVVLMGPQHAAAATATAAAKGVAGIPEAPEAAAAAQAATAEPGEAAGATESAEVREC